jgi:hypothetical protein
VRIPADKVGVATDSRRRSMMAGRSIGVTVATLEVSKRARMSGMNIVVVPLFTKRYILAR